MTREEAITSYEKRLYAYMVGNDDAIDMDYGEFMELNHYIRTALSPVSREQVEKMKSPWKSYFNGDYNDEIYYCEECGHKLESYSKLPNFCPDCGVPKTDEAVQMVMERMEALKDGL